ncbi:hypothetical protein EYC84_004732 [Monilinia fructicola]|uniref:Uncharacterized protein n=1 Tax=Monilinia fructicola TaxID=38448 RepID=A0A5M9K243_MONFR|nr:hypothetical protein EYC84_004732 [Monilinia fructicola]
MPFMVGTGRLIVLSVPAILIPNIAAGLIMIVIDITASKKGSGFMRGPKHVKMRMQYFDYPWIRNLCSPTLPTTKAALACDTCHERTTPIPVPPKVQIPTQ